MRQLHPLDDSAFAERLLPTASTAEANAACSLRGASHQVERSTDRFVEVALLRFKQPAALLVQLLDRNAHDLVALHRTIVVQPVAGTYRHLGRDAVHRLVMGATVTVDILPTISSRIRTKTGRRLSSVAM